MRKGIDELNQIPPDYRIDRDSEITPPPDEFNRFPAEQKPKRKEPSAMRKIMLYLASIGVVVLGIITPIIRLNPSGETDVPPETPAAFAETTAAPLATREPTSTPAPTEAPTAEPTPAPTAEPTPEPTPEPAPTPMSGKIHVTVYSNVVYWTVPEGEDPGVILYEETFDAATFTGIELPQLPTLTDYTSYGYVLLSYDGLAYLYGLYFDEFDPHTIGSVALNGNMLTADDLQIVPKSIEDIYQANVYAVWVAKEPNRFHLEFYDEDLFGDYYVGFLSESEGLVYLAPFPKPTREGLTFAGWCDKDGNIIDAVTWFDFFPVIEPAESMEDRDWKHPIPCRVFACWTDAEGNTFDTRGRARLTPDPTPEPTEAPTPTPKPTPKPTKKPTPTMYSIALRGCTFSGGGYTDASSGRVAAGTTITITGKSNYSSAADFKGSPSSAERHFEDPSYTSDGYYVFTYRYTVNSDVAISFYSIIN